MRTMELPYRATSAQACAWLAQQTGSPWSLARLIEHRLTPSVWLDYDDPRGGHALPLRLAGDAGRLGSASEVGITVVITIAEVGGHGRQVVSELRFLKKDLERLAQKLAQKREPRRARQAIAA